MARVPIMLPDSFGTQSEELVNEVCAKSHLAKLEGQFDNTPNPNVGHVELHRLLKLHQPDIIDLDTEFAGWSGSWDSQFDIRSESCCNRVRPFLVSLAFQGCESGVVFEATNAHMNLLNAYLSHFRPLVCAHNAPVDIHALDNAETPVNLSKYRVLDTLQAAKWFFPSYDSFGLDALHRRDFPELPGKQLSFAEVFKYNEQVQWVELDTKLKAVTICACGVSGCRLRKANHEKTKTEVYVDCQRKKSRVVQGVITVDDLKKNDKVYTGFCFYAKDDAAMLHRWRTKMLWPKINLQARAVPPPAVRFFK